MNEKELGKALLQLETGKVRRHPMRRSSRRKS
jgi:hypothetical protein